MYKEKLKNKFNKKIELDQANLKKVKVINLEEKGDVKSSNIAVVESRDYLFDNLKAILIFLVIFGHVIDRFDNTFLKYVFEFIYIFHMPVFVFISGYFSKKPENINKYIKNLLLPYFVFNTIYNIYLVYFDPSFNEELKDINIFYPRGIYWYLISLFLWRILIKYVKELKHPLILTILLSLYIGVIDNAGRFLSISRTIAYFPFFIIGFYTSKDIIEKIRNYKKRYMIILAVVVFISSIIFVHLKIMKKDILYNAISYNLEDLKNLWGIGIRFIQMILSVLFGIILIKFVSNKKIFISKIGKRTITVVVFSLYFQSFIMKIVEKINLMNYLYNNMIALSIFVIVASLIILFLSSNEFIFNIYNKILNLIYKLFIKNDKSN